MLRGLRTRLGAGALGSWERLFCQPGPGPCTLRPGTVGSGAWGLWGHEVVGLSVLGSGALGPRHRGVGYSGAWVVESGVWGPWGRVLWARGPWSRVLGGRGVVRKRGRGSLHRVLWAGDSGAREVDRGVPREPVAWLF